MVAEAAATASRVVDELDARGAPVALVARVGTDLSKQGQHYSHVGFVLRDHADGRWTVVHLLNRCGTARSALYAQGLVNYFADSLHNHDVGIFWLRPELAAEVVVALGHPSLVHEPRYNLIARYDNRHTQNSTAWVLDTIGVALGGKNRQDAQRLVRANGFRPDVVHVSYGKRIAGGLFAANLDFTDHPIGTRLKGDYPVVTADSIFRWLDDRGWVAASSEWRGSVSPE
jgi:hypothetical protein